MATGAVGAWAGRDLSLACRQGGNWLFVEPRDGLRILDRSTGQEQVLFGSWRKASLPTEPLGGSTVDGEARLAINELITALQALGLLPSA
ncbi:hypothetical protein GCM10011494_03700 [Novosphingobium endophyticum]|uniref:DUF2793 domain-containing protein n=1 Tax=Novosphingobium endophyticum TaxID=1955250 RepID=A0A916X345_9SPHN|nr:hypothetical protein GCM10011494_03700 [Novosphingobium endophyticum]